MIGVCACGNLHNGIYGDQCEDCYIDGSRICVKSAPEGSSFSTPSPESPAAPKARKQRRSQRATKEQKDKAFISLNPRR